MDREAWMDVGVSLNTYTGGRQAQDKYVRELAMVKWRRVLDDPSYALAMDPDVWRQIRRDARFKFLIERRMRSTASRGWRIVPATDDPADKIAAGIAEQAVKLIPNFWMQRKRLAAADFRGTAYVAMTGALRHWSPLITPVGGGVPVRANPQEWWMFGKFKPIDRYRFRVVPSSTDKPWQHELYSPQRGKWEPLYHPEWFIRHVYDDEEDTLGHGEGLLDALYFIWYTKITCLELGLHGVEAWANGRLSVKVQGLRAPSGKTNAEVEQAWRNATKHWLSDHVLTYDSNDEVAMHDGPTQGHNMAVEFLHYCDNSASQLVLGAVLPFGGKEGGSGSLARAEEEGAQADEYLQPSRDMLGETLSEQMLGYWWKRNVLPLESLGLGNASCPKLELYSEPRKDTKKNAEVLGIAMQYADVKEDEFYDKLDLSAPGPEDKVIQKAAPQPAASPFSGFNRFQLDQPAGTGNGNGNGQAGPAPAYGR